MFLSAVNIGLLVAVVATGGREASGATWHYPDAANWGADYPNCGGMQQSPINLNRFASSTGEINTIQFHNYNVLPRKQTVINDGHTVKVEITATSQNPYIEWNVFWIINARYNFAQYHFHWGSVSSQGSEHTIDTIRYPMELHLVHFNDKYSDIGRALTKPDGLAVLGIFFVISPYDNPALAPLIAAIGEVVDYVADPNYVEKDNLYSLASLLPYNTKRFFRYDGSLTTPTCDESVLWTVFEEPIEISEAQIDVFRTVIGSDGSSSDNYRPIQALNGRKIHHRTNKGRRLIAKRSTDTYFGNKFLGRRVTSN